MFLNSRQYFEMGPFNRPFSSKMGHNHEELIKSLCLHVIAIFMGDSHHDRVSA